MVLENKLGITEGSVLSCEEERLSKKKAIKLFTDELLKKKRNRQVLYLSLYTSIFI